MKNGKVIDLKGSEFYYVNNLLHREDGPAVIWFDDIKEWHYNDLLHREDGPAIEYPSGKKTWYYHGEKIPVSSQEEFIKYINLIFIR